MWKDGNILFFDSDQVFNDIISNGEIPLNYFQTSSIEQNSLPIAYYISPRRQFLLNNQNNGTSFVSLWAIPENFIVKTLEKINRVERPVGYNVVDIMLILHAIGVDNVSQRNRLAIKASVNLIDGNIEEMGRVMTAILFNTVLINDKYSIFQTVLGLDGRTFQKGVVYAHAFIFTLRKKVSDDTILTRSKLKVPFRSNRTQLYEGKFLVPLYIGKGKYVEAVSKRIPEEEEPIVYNEADIKMIIDETKRTDLEEYKKELESASDRIKVHKDKIDEIKRENERLREEQYELIEIIRRMENFADDVDVDITTGRIIPIGWGNSLAYEQRIGEIDTIMNQNNNTLNILEKDLAFYISREERFSKLINDLGHVSIEDDYAVSEYNYEDYLNEDDYMDWSDNGDRAGSYVELPKVISTQCRKCILNIRNDTDKRCFYYTVNAWYMIKNNIPVKNKKNTSRPSNYNGDWFKWGSININDFKIKNIKEFCILNNVGVVVWKIVNDELIKIVNCNMYQDVIPLLYYDKHIMLIKDCNKLFNIIAKGLHLRRLFMCNQCYGFYSHRDKVTIKHEKYDCKSRKEFIVREREYKLPRTSNISFKNIANKIKCRYIITADYESLLPKTIINDVITNSYKINMHNPFMIGYAFTIEDTLYEAGYFKGETCSDQFLTFIDGITQRIKEEKQRCRMDVVKIDFQGEVICQICNKLLCDDVIIARDICQFAIHATCYDYVLDKVFSLKVIFHNFKNYDSHFIIDVIFKNKKQIFTIPKTKEKYTTIQYINDGVNVKFMDSYAFLQGSLDSLAKRLTSKKYGRVEAGKMTFPYEYIDCYEKLEEPCLPSNRNDWFSSLRNCAPPDEEINASIEYFKKKKFKSIYEYAVEYMMTDVYLLLEIVYNFRTTSFNTYGIDPLHYYTLPGYAWDVTLSVIDVKPCLLMDREMINIIVDNIRGGISSVSKRKWLQDNENNSIFYFDANNLYGWAMSQPLPYDDFTFIEIPFNEVLHFILFYDMDVAEYGYILTVDMEYPQREYDLHNELPFLPERINDKLCLSLYNKRMYTAHILNIKQAIEEGLVLEKVYKIIRYRQSKWLEKYISLNTELRKNSTSDSDKNFYKLMNNAVFGKTMQNPLKECKYIPVGINDDKERVKMEKKISYKSQEQWTDNLILYEMDKVPVMDKPIYIGFVILELSKWKMYDTFYKGIKRKWPTCTLSYMDTDSFVINIPQKRCDIDFKGVEHYFDLSVYPKDSKWYSIENKGVLGKLKDEFPENYIKEFICLRSKMYGINTNDGSFIYKCKGISKITVLSMEDLKTNLRDNLALYTNQVNIKSIRHNVGTWITNKKTLPNNQDDKRINIMNNDEEEEYKKYLTNSLGFI